MAWRVAITGLGIISSIGNTIEDVAASLRTGKSGIIADPERHDLGFASCLTGRIAIYAPSFPLSRKQRKTMPDFAQWAAEACLLGVWYLPTVPGRPRRPRAGAGSVRGAQPLYRNCPDRPCRVPSYSCVTPR